MKRQKRKVQSPPPPSEKQLIRTLTDWGLYIKGIKFDTMYDIYKCKIRNAVRATAAKRKAQADLIKKQGPPKREFCATLGCGDTPEGGFHHCTSHILFHDRTDYQKYLNQFKPTKTEAE